MTNSFIDSVTSFLIKSNAQLRADTKPHIADALRKTQTVLSDSLGLFKIVAQKDKTGKIIKVSVLPQDPAVGPEETIEFPQEKIGNKLSGERVQVVETNPKFALAKPDSNGDYIFKAGTPQSAQVNSYVTVYRTLDMYEEFIGYMIFWAFGGQKLLDLPHQKEWRNAYYSRNEQSVNFGYFYSDKLKKVVRTAESSDVVSHETGHAVLDALRPDYISTFSGKETMAFHEAFADITAMLLALTNENNLKAILAENKGDFRKESLLSRISEEFGKAKHLDDNDPANDDKIYLRTAINNFTYKDPNSLPGGKDEDKLTSEPHNFSRLFTATVYDCLEGFFKQNLAEAPDRLTALKTAGSRLGEIFACAAQRCPITKCKYKDIALAMLEVDKRLTGGKYQEVMKKIFLARKILNANDLKAKALPELKLGKSVRTKEDALNFIKRHKDALDISLPPGLKADNIYANRKGETFISYSFDKEVPVKGEGLKKYKDCVTRISGGFALAFDAQGKLTNFTQDLIDENKIRDAMNEIKDYDKSGVIADTRRKGKTGEVFNEKGELYRVVIKEPYGKSHNRILQKIPVIE